MHGARRGASVPAPVVELDLHALDHGTLQGVEMVRCRRDAVVPSGRVEDDSAGRRLGLLAEGRGEGLHELAQRSPHFGRGVGRAGDEEEGPNLVGTQAAQVGAGAAHELPASAAAGL